MRFGRILFHRCRSLFRRSRAEADLKQEFAIHIEQLAKEQMAEGVSEAEAFAAARRAFGSIGVTQEQCRDMRRTGWIEDLWRDLAFALRGLRKSPIFTMAALLTLALGIGANTVIYSFMDAILLRTLPIAEPKNLVVFNWRAQGSPEVAHSQHGDGYKEPGGAAVSGTFPYPAWESLREHNDALTTLFAFAGAGRLNIVAGNQAFLGEGEYVAGNYFSGLAVPASVGRLIGNEDDRAGGNAVAVISYRLWQKYFQGAASAVGQTIHINRNAFTVIGVTTPEFYGVNPSSAPDVYLPMHLVAGLDPRARQRDWFHERDNYWVEMMGRLRPGVTREHAEKDMAFRFHQFVVATARNDKERANLPALWLQEGDSGIDSLRRRYSQPLYILLAMTSLILAIACANVANLLLSRATARRREIAVRLSLGAGRWRLIRQLLTESVLLAVFGGLLGLFVTALGIRFLTWILANGSENFTLGAAIDLRILIFTAAVSILTGVMFGLVPAVQSTKVDVAPVLKESRNAVGRERRRSLPFGISQVLVVGQIALSLLLVISAGLFVRTLSRLHSVSIGFNKDNLLIFNVNAAQAGYDEGHSPAFYESLRLRLAEAPGVRGATMTDMPLVAGSSSSTGLAIPGRPVPHDREKDPSTNITMVGPHFFDTMQIPILLGRPVTERDESATVRVVVVNQAFADKFFPGQSALGRRIKLNDQSMEIVGVARDSLYSSIKDGTPPVTYVPWSQPPKGWLIGDMYYEVRAAGDPLGLTNAIRKIVHDADPRIPIASVSTQTRYIDATISSERTFANLCTGFAVLALVIACVGLYGTTAYGVARRTNEIGIRMALGAQRGRVVWMVLSEVLTLSSIGVAIGLSVGWATTRFVSSFLFGVKAKDLGVFGLSALILTACALAAGYGPAWRASRIEAMEALRHE